MELRAILHGKPTCLEFLSKCVRFVLPKEMNRLQRSPGYLQIQNDCLHPMRRLGLLRPVAAADYFFRSRWLGWFAVNIIGIIPIWRGTGTSGDGDPLAEVGTALDRGEIVILFPEGSRGEPEELQALKSGLSYLVEQHPTVPVIPVFLYGLGKALPRGESLLVPFFCDVVIGERVAWPGDRKQFTEDLGESLTSLADEIAQPDWT